ncbi:MAG: hypothetical protein RDV48_17345 [Candidatus Eremiobacteraeota bacterium]|nr:hypothetical protein [Candidatus Eremiobacteraeota bacterium]
MAELGQIHPRKKLACPHCSVLLTDDVLVSIVELGVIDCAHCGQPIRLPERVVEELRRSAHVGRNLDITM